MACLKVPASKRFRIAHFPLLEIEWLSFSAMQLSSESMNSDSIVPVSMFSFSNRIVTPSAVRPLTIAMQSDVFRENRLIDFVRIRLIFPALQSASIRCSSGRLSVLVALSPCSK